MSIKCLFIILSISSWFLLGESSNRVIPLVPNLAFESGDYLNNVTSKELFDIFNTNPNVVDASSVNDKDIDISILKEPLGNNISEIEENPANGKTISNFERDVGQPNYVSSNTKDKAYVNGPSEFYYTDSNFKEGQYFQYMNPKNQLPEETPEFINSYPDIEHSNLTLKSQPSLRISEQKLFNIENSPYTELNSPSYFVSDGSQYGELPFYYDEFNQNLISSGYSGIDDKSSVNFETEYSRPNHSLLGNFKSRDSTLPNYHESDEPVIKPNHQNYSEINSHNTDIFHSEKTLKDYLNSNYSDSEKPVPTNDLKKIFESSYPKTGSVHLEHTDSKYPIASGVYSESSHLSYTLPDSHYSSLPKQSKPQLIYPYKGNYFDIFEKWFKDEMEGFRKIQSADNKLNDDFVRTLVQELLLQNDIFVTKDGMVTKYGVKLNINSLSLRPIMIGDSVGYEKLLQLKDKLEDPSRSDFLKAVLISLGNPSKILGIIPLGKTLVPNKNWQLYITPEDNVSSHEHSDFIAVNDDTGLDSKVKSEYAMFKPPPNNVHYTHKYQIPSHKKTFKPTVKYICNIRNCKKEQNRPSFDVEKRVIPGRPRVEHEHAPHRTGYKRRKGLKWKHVNSDQKLVAKKLRKTSKKGDEIMVKTRRFPLARLLSKVLSFLNPESTEFPNASETNKTEEKSTSQLVDGNFEKEEEEEDDSMYRIIGGTPATGSGAPLNSRGKRFTNV